MSNYKFKQGKYNASGLHIGVHFGIKEQSYQVKFSKECLYSILNWENDWNKLCGWSYGLLPVKWEVGFSSSPDFRLFGVDYVWAHHYNSIRVCWRAKDNKIELCLYIYEKGIRRTSASILIDIEKDYELEVVIQQAYFNLVPQTLFLEAKGEAFGLSIDYSAKPSKGYRLFPVFGGNDPTPHEMNIKLERL